VPDGLGGWYIGGRFTRVGSQQRQNLAHILPDLTVDRNWNPGANGDVKALVVKDNIVYAGGDFTRIGGGNRKRLAAIGADGELLVNWDPDVNDPEREKNKIPQRVNALVVSGNTVYAGGDFSIVGGNVSNGLVAIGTDGVIDIGWNPSAEGGSVKSLAVAGNIVYAGGEFTTIGGVTRNRLAAIVGGAGDNRGSLTGWNPNVEDGSVNALALSGNGNTVYVGGSFTTIGGVGRNRLVALKTADGSVRPRWNLNLDREVNTLAVIDNVVYVGINGQRRSRLAALRTDGTVIDRWNPRPNNNVNTLAVSGDTLYVGGVFTTIGRASVVRKRLAATGPDGNLTSWNPSVDRTIESGGDVRVNSLAYAGNTIYAGGTFNSVNGIVAKNLVAINTVGNGSVNTDWVADADDTVRSLVLDSNGVLYAGGDFTQIGGDGRNFRVTRNSLVAISSDGTLNGWNPGANGPVHTLAVVKGINTNKEIIYIGGSFTEAAGVARGALAAVGVDGVLDSWDPELKLDGQGTVLASSLAISGNTVYVGGKFTGVGGNNGYANLASIDINGTVNTGWNPQVDKEVNVLTVSKNIVYAGGIFDKVNSVCNTKRWDRCSCYRLETCFSNGWWWCSCAAG